jgi:hypothetical protein
MGFSEPFWALFYQNEPSDNCRLSLQSDLFLRVGLPQRPAKSHEAPVERLTDAVCYAVKWLKSSSRKFVNKGKKKGRIT